jgi:sRNA-binding carbon storage regulator CsrA
MPTGRKRLWSLVSERKVRVMMVVSREEGQGIRIEVPGHGEVFVFVGKILDESAVHLEIDAARSVAIYRGEVWEAIKLADEQN